MPVISAGDETQVALYKIPVLAPFVANILKLYKVALFLPACKASCETGHME
jgi:hypothetical protein